MDCQAVVLLIFLLLTHDVTLAYDYCGNGFYCNDAGSQISYCCGYSISGYPLCCFYTAWYALWYVWFIVVIVILLASAVVTYCCKRAHPSRQSVAAVDATTVATVPSATATTTFPMYPNNGFQMEGAPPRYETIQQNQQWILQNQQNKNPPYPSQMSEYTETQHLGQPINSTNVPAATISSTSHQSDDSHEAELQRTAVLG